MSSEKSVIIVPQTPRNLCPICGKAAYSLGGIHPQCAMQQADRDRRAVRFDEIDVDDRGHFLTPGQNRFTCLRWRERAPGERGEAYANGEPRHLPAVPAVGRSASVTTHAQHVAVGELVEGFVTDGCW